ncbi:non-ribosomal peptide synthase/polyketide synthase [Scytonema millei]|uniref:non-ribosomal peptide synthase/polyketide synthase n=1 Tax=Scytonema millei TaxID=1245922 RepID=UPI00398C20E2
MKTIEEFLSYLCSLDIKLWVDGERLRCSAPEGTLSPSLRLQLQERKAEILAFLQKANQTSSAPLPPISSVSRAGKLPLSFAQQRLWFLQQLEVNSGFYNIAAAVRFEGRLHNIAALESSLNYIINRHEVLRTNFIGVDGQPIQAIANSKTVELAVIDLQQLHPTERESTCQQLRIEEVAQPFDLVNNTLLRASLFKLTETEHILLLVMHHIVSDWWSMSVLVRELAAVYHAKCNDLPLALPELPIQYADFAHWQQQWLQEEVLTKQLVYWKEQLAGVPALLELPTDRPRPAIQTYRGAIEKFSLSKELSETLAALSQKQGATLFMTLLAAFQSLLYRYSGQTDICVGTPIANRNRNEIEGLIGLFANTLVLRSNLSGNPSFSDLLSQVREVALGAYAHQDLPFEQLVEQLQPERSLSHTPLFQVMFTLQAALSELQFPGLKGSLLPAESSTAKFDLTLVLENTSAGLMGVVEYNTDLFDATTIARMVEHYQTLLEAVVANPHQKLSELPLLGDREQHQMLVEWNDTQANYPKQLCLHSLFEQQVQKTPDAVAVVFEDKQLTYTQLNAKANQLAHHLLQLGVGPEVLVAICVERSIEMLVGLLAILKAGGAYVPLDPIYPPERLAYILEDSGAKVLLAQQAVAELLPETHGHVVYLDTDWPIHQSSSNPNTHVCADNLAYAIYTSGSTGRPKGVQIPHRAVVNFLNSMSAQPGIVSEDVLVAVTTITFDIAALELFLPLSKGARVVLTCDLIADGGRSTAALGTSSATIMQGTPATWRALMQAGFLGNPQLKILCGGEALDRELAAQLLERADSLWNMYGPTETTIWSAVSQVQPDSGAVSIGRAIANTQFYILDANLQPVPVGVAGELHIGGDGLARGYLSRPELTAEKFIPNPFSNQPGERLYKTGDLVRYKSNGTIEYIGRIDHQVKVRGFRIELGEIEALLSQYPTVQQAVVIAKEIGGDKRLVGYLVPQTQTTPVVSELRSFLKQQLPEYMVPSYFVVLDAFPLTPNGKVDRKALPDPSGQSQVSQDFVAPRTPIEEMLASIWASLLQLDRVGIHDNFFTLGGHSLLATQLMSRVQSTFAVELPLRSLFELPTVATLAESIATAQQSEPSQQTLPIVRVPRQMEMPVSFAQQRLWFLQQFEPESGFYNIPVAVRFQGQLNIIALEQSLNYIISRHEALRTNFVRVDGQPMQVIASSMPLSLRVVDLQQMDATDGEITCQQLIAVDAVRPFDLATDLLVRASLFQFQPTEHVLLLVMHHIVSDAWSMGVLVRELATVYQAICNELPIALPELPIQYADFTLWQQQWLQGEVLAKQLEYWQQQLAGAPSLLELPTDRSRPAIQTYTGATERFLLSQQLSEKLVVLSQKQEVTLFMTLLAAFQTLLYRYSGQTDICVGTPIANRNRKETEELIGLFVNTLVLRSNLSGNPSFSDLLSRVREVALGAYAHQDLPFEQLVEQLQPERSLSYTPLFQVMFVLQNAPMPELELADLTLASLAIESSTAKFDLTLFLENTNAGLMGAIEYNTDLFDASTIARMVEHYQTLLEAVVANADQKLSELPLLGARQLHQYLVEWNKTEAVYPQNVCLHALFEQQVERTPNAEALVYEEQRLTYSELNAKANQLAHYLLSLGVGPEVFVGVCVERSVDMVVGLLGILKAGGAYVPLDPAYPSGRLSYMLSDSQVSVLLTQAQLRSQLPAHQARVVALDTDWSEIAQYSPDNCATSVTPDNLAYVIYTSGSTGNPKGVAICHHSPVTLVQWAQEVFTPQQCAGVLASTSICFDLSVFELFVPLSCGGKIVLAQNALHLPNLAASDEVTLINTVPSAIAELQRMNGIPATVQTVNLAGEALQNQLVQKIYEQQTIQQVFNLYGPSEDTTYSTFALVEKGATGTPSIGRAIANTQVYILDAQMQPVPIGVAGELYIAGEGLARGYLNRPELTAEKFVPNPFAADKSSQRLYRTGDLVRYRADGNIEYIGRIDHQVKVRGFRIELGEIEAVLSQHPNVRQVVVIATQEMVGATRLVAYLVANQQPAPTISELRAFLKQKLPEYMVPSAFVVLDALPLTPNGKLDRKALPKPSWQPELSNRFVAPRTPIEETLANIWATVLGLESVGIHDNFFELGGDSILSLQIIAKASSAGVQLSAKQMFEYQTIAELAAVADTTEAITAQQGVVSGTLPLTPIQQWFFLENFAVSAYWNQAVLLEMPQGIQPHLLEQVVRELLVHHDALRLRFEKTDSGWQQINAGVEAAVPFTVVDLSALSQAQQQAAIEAKAAELQGSLNLASGPLLQVAWFNLGEELNSRVLVVVHHLAVDGVSWRILLEDLQLAYRQLSAGRAIQLPAKTTSFKDWAQLQWEYVRSQNLQRQCDFWLVQSHQPVANMPVDSPGGANTEASARTVSMSLSVEETRALLQEVPQAYNTQINDVLLAALVQVLAHWMQSTHVLFDLEGHGREEILENINISRTVGWFTTIFPVVLHHTCDHPGETLKSIKEQLRRIPNQGISYGWLRYLLDDQETIAQLSAQRPAEIVFNHLGQFDSVLQTSEIFQLASESTGPSRSPLNHRTHLLEVNSIIFDSQLRVDWTYSQNLHHSSTIERIAHEFLQALRGLINHCLAPEAGGYTPTDFPLVQLNNIELDKLLSNVLYTQGITKNKKPIADLYPLSSVQQGMLFHTLYTPSSGVYCQQFSCTFIGGLDVGAFIAAWQQVVERHVVLRTAFTWEHSEQPLQVVFRQVKLPLEIYSWTGLTSEQQQQQLVSFIEQDRKLGFQLSKAPLMRLTLIQMSDDVYQFIWSYHHILLDGWSLPLVFKEVLGYYQALSVGQELQLPSSRSYRKYIAWLQKQNLEVAEQFWRQTLHGITAPTPLVVDTHYVSEPQSYSEEILTLSSETTSALVSFARQHQLTLNTLVQAAWALLLSRYSGETDVVFGVIVSGRSPAIKGVESIVGLFINTLPMRVEVSHEDTILPKLKQIQKLQVEMSAYEYTPLLQIQGWSDVPKGLPLFESIVVFENYPVDAALEEHSQNLQIGDVRTFERTNYPLTLIAQPGVELSLRFIYDSQRFESESVTRMMGHFQTLLQGLVANPNQKLSELPLLGARELHQYLVEWNKTEAVYPQNVCLHALFEQQVERTPNAEALVYEEQRLTYSELNAKANQLAHYLLSLGVGPEVFVGVCVERSVDMVVGLLGILKAGGAYVPLDPAYPSGRLSYMLSDSQVSVLLTQAQLRSQLPAHQARVVALDTDWSEIAQYSPDNCATSVTPDNLAYVIYTSGSTGNPKGVAICHHSPVTLVQWAQEVFTPQQCAGVLASTSICFDLSVFELFVPLSCGGKIVLAQNALHLPNLAASDEVTLINTVPSAIAELQRMNGIPATVQTVNLAGEALQNQLVQKIYQLDNIQQVFNLYGPSEDTTYSTFALVEKGATEEPSIGRPIANTQVYILDAQMQPVPIGVAGELYLSGEGLARGYLNRPELTAEKFVSNPFATDKSNQRLYKTGDLARYLPDGNIGYIGRIDHQVKVRGFRIELGEIEAVLSQHPNVRQVVVIATQEMVGATRLVAYLVANQQPAPTISELRAFLKQKLPEYMVPSAFVVLDALPLTPNGKLDRKALPKPSWQPELSNRFVAPRTPIEETLANIWASVLAVESVGIHDNFFELGGDSILSLQIIAKASNAGVQLSAKQMFEYQTIAELAAVADTTGAITAQQGVVSGVLPLTPIQQWFFEKNFAVSAHWNQAVLLEMPQGIQPHLLEPVVRELLVHHDALRLRFEKTDSGWQQINALVDETVPFTMVDLSALPQAQQVAAIEAKAAELQASLDLASGPLVQVAWFNLGEELNSRVLVVVHHLAVDGVSWRILLEDLQVAYGQLSTGRAIQLPAKTTSFKDWAQLQWEYVQSQNLQRQYDFWLVQSHQPVANIPVDYLGGANTEASARTVSMSLSVEETRALLQEVPQAYNTQINDVLLAALVQVLAHWMQSTHVLFDLEGHGREEILENINISRTVGWFTTIFPVVLHHTTDVSGEALKSVKEQLRRIPQQGISYGWLRYLLDDKETIAQLSAQRPAEIVFNHLGQFDSVLQTSEIFQLASESTGPSRSPLNHRTHLLEVNSIIFDSQLRVDWTYSQNLHHSSTIERIAHEFLQALRGLINHCLAPEAGGYTPTDFPAAGLSQTDLDDLFAQLEEIES